MSMSPRSTSTSTLRPMQRKGENTPPVVRMLRSIYHRQDGGWFELQVIDGDPSIKGTPTITPADVERWHTWQPNNPAWLATFVQLVDELAARYGNVYISRTCYTVPRRNKAYAMPSYALVREDAPAGAYTFTVQTSAKSQQAWLITDEPMDGATYSDLARRAAYDADRSGADVEQLVRIPSTYNTKKCTNRNQWWPVTIEPAANRTFPLDELRRRWPAVALAEAEPIMADAGLVEHYLTNVKLLLNGWGYPRRLKLDSPGVKILKQRSRVDDRSAARYSVAKALYLHGYPDAELAALLLHFCDYGQSSEKGSTWLDTDIARIIGKLHAHYPTVQQNPSRLDGDPQPAQPRTRCEPEQKGRGRPKGMTAEEAWAKVERLAQDAPHDGDGALVLDMTQKQTAKAIGCGLHRFQGYEHQWTGALLVDRQVTTDRQRSFLRLLPTVHAESRGTKKSPCTPANVIPENTQADAVHIDVCSMATPQTVIDAQPTGEHTPAPDLVPLGGVFSPDAAASPAPAPTLVEMVREALDANGAGLVGRHMPTRVKQTARYIADNFGCQLHPSQLETLITREQTRRKYAAEVEHLKTLDAHELQRFLRATERCQVRAHAADRPRQAKMYGHKLQAIRNEYTRRGLDPAVRMPRMKRSIPGKPLPLLDDIPLVVQPDLQGQRWHALWHGPDTDVPVLVLRVLGEVAGRWYYGIDGSATGIPADEVELVAPVDEQPITPEAPAPPAVLAQEPPRVPAVDTAPLSVPSPPTVRLVTAWRYAAFARERERGQGAPA